MRLMSPSLDRHEKHGVLPRQSRVRGLGFRMTRGEIRLLKCDRGGGRCFGWCTAMRHFIGHAVLSGAGWSTLSCWCVQVDSWTRMSSRPITLPYR